MPYFILPSVLCIRLHFLSVFLCISLHYVQRAVAKDTVVADSSSVDRPTSKKEPAKTDTPPTAVAAKTTKPVSKEKEKEKEKEKKKPLCPYGTKCYRYIICRLVYLRSIHTVF